MLELATIRYLVTVLYALRPSHQYYVEDCWISDLSCYKVIFICLQVFHLLAQFYHIGFLALHLVAKQCRGYRVSFARMPCAQSYASQVL